MASSDVQAATQIRALSGVTQGRERVISRPADDSLPWRLPTALRVSSSAMYVRLGRVTVGSATATPGFNRDCRQYCAALPPHLTAEYLERPGGTDFTVRAY